MDLPAPRLIGLVLPRFVPEPGALEAGRGIAAEEAGWRSEIERLRAAR